MAHMELCFKSPFVSLLIVACTAGSAVVASANTFLRQVGHAESAALTDKAILGEIEDLLGADHRRATENRLSRIEARTRLAYAAMAKNEHGRLEAPAVRYILHRYFVQRHAWHVRGLEPAGTAWNASSPTTILQQGVPEHVQELFEQRIGRRGFDLHEVAVLAATLENLVHREATERLEYTYRVLERTPRDPLTKEESHEVIDTYMANYILGFEMNKTSPTEVQELQRKVREAYPSWPQTQAFSREVQAAAVPDREEHTFESVALVIEEIAERYGHWQDKECQQLKGELMEMEHRGSGRVRLAEFYGSALNQGKWQFSESVAYLRQLGALDESDENEVKVIIPNYVNSPSNCVASSDYYSVCCLDECEGLLGHLEEQIGAPEATPAEVSALVRSLPSATVAANRTLPAWLLRRLNEVAEHHGGEIPLHGRLFLQWMHLAFPRECSYPHVTGTTNPQRAEEWVSQTGIDVVASEEEMRWYVTRAAPAPGNVSETTSKAEADDEPEAEEISLWTQEEELVVVRPNAVAKARGKPVFLQALMFAAAIASITFTLMKTFGAAASTVDGRPPSKYSKMQMPSESKYCV